MDFIFDSHAHYDDEAFDEDRDDILSSLPLKGVVAVINCGANLSTSVKSIELAEKYPFIKAAAGIHPEEAKGDFPKEKLPSLLKNKNVVAVGEIGLDYHYDFSPRELQLYFCEEQIKIANELSLPIIFHDREAHGDTLELLKKYRPNGVVHCFSGSVEMAKEIIKLGMYIGLGGAVTFKNAKNPPEVANAIPLDRLLLETDAPYMTPVPYRGKRCDSSMIKYTAQKIAEVRGTDIKEIYEAAASNAEALFGINLRR